MFSTSSRVVARSGSSNVARNQRGRAPAVATSFAFTCTAYQPISSVANVTGSDLATSRFFSPNAMTATSSPTPGPIRTRGSAMRPLRSSSCRKAGANLPGLNSRRGMSVFLSFRGRATSKGKIHSPVVLVLLLVLDSYTRRTNEGDDEDEHEERQAFSLVCYSSPLVFRLIA